jgi:hypothetical protein
VNHSRYSLGRVLLWILLIILALIALSVLFGGFQKGTKSAGLGMPRGGPLGSTHAARLVG